MANQAQSVSNHKRNLLAKVNSVNPKLQQVPGTFLSEFQFLCFSEFPDSAFLHALASSTDWLSS